ncbi:hypothetical protein DUNSADRAFT_2377 [Dunaliella salina]|uniref:Uncharacterized protein n=1 Tax=Dunaliella salina TaxID=3046 RepID=A0ABQ7GVP7_DUNSA|nr:hypothetical protein DUNSADRAFT_2377 [Dunaliella salina]|eukprot:KAF5838682.1 hypothetical protein DUNSADRAFT_2377 [Dunaliella salina]
MKTLPSAASVANGRHAVRAFPAQRLGQVKPSRRGLRARAEAIKVGKCWAVPPPNQKPPRGIVHFLGGAFISGAPQVLYSLLIDSLASSGFTVLSTPYAVSFKHLDCAATVRQDFMDSLQSDQVYTDANVLMSYNNKQVSDAIPIPGLLDALGPTARAAPSLPEGLPTPSTVLNVASGLLPSGVLGTLGLSQRQVADAGLLIEQLGSVVKEVGDGNSDFTPTPEESRQIVKAGYNPTATPTLLVQFTNDNFDQTPEMLDILQECARPDAPWEPHHTLWDRPAVGDRPYIQPAGCTGHGSEAAVSGGTPKADKGAGGFSGQCSSWIAT